MSFRSNFHKHTKSKDSSDTRCKSCITPVQKEYDFEEKEKENKILSEKSRSNKRILA